MTLSWNAAAAAVGIAAAFSADSVALAGFGLYSAIALGASTVLIWKLKGTGGAEREFRAQRLIGFALIALSFYLSAQAAYILLAPSAPADSPLGIGWTAATCLVMLALAAAVARTGKALGNRSLQAQARATQVDAYLAGAVCVGLLLNAALGWWWADPAAALAIAYCAIREAKEAFA